MKLWRADTYKTIMNIKIAKPKIPPITLPATRPAFTERFPVEEAVPVFVVLGVLAIVGRPDDTGREGEGVLVGDVGSCEVESRVLATAAVDTPVVSQEEP